MALRQQAQTDKAPRVALRIQGVMLSLAQHSVYEWFGANRKRLEANLLPSYSPEYNTVERMKNNTSFVAK